MAQYFPFHACKSYSMSWSSSAGWNFTKPLKSAWCQILCLHVLLIHRGHLFKWVWYMSCQSSFQYIIVTLELYFQPALEILLFVHRSLFKITGWHYCARIHICATQPYLIDHLFEKQKWSLKIGDKTKQAICCAGLTIKLNLHKRPHAQWITYFQRPTTSAKCEYLRRVQLYSCTIHICT